MSPHVRSDAIASASYAFVGAQRLQKMLLGIVLIMSLLPPMMIGLPWRDMLMWQAGSLVFYLSVFGMVLWISLRSNHYGALWREGLFWSWRYTRTLPKTFPEYTVWYSDGAGASTAHLALEQMQAFPQRLITTEDCVYALYRMKNFVYLLRLRSNGPDIKVSILSFRRVAPSALSWTLIKTRDMFS